MPDPEATATVTNRFRSMAGWLAVVASTGLACFWAFWGILENFHEGWYFDSIWSNLSLMVVQYLFPMLFFMAAGWVAIRRKWVGAALHGVAAVALMSQFRPWYSAGGLIIAIPLAGLGLLYVSGHVRPRRAAVRVLLGLPAVVLVVCGTEPAVRVAGRVDDGDRGVRAVEGNGVRLEWAPRGPGWPDEGVPWADAVRRCRHLTADGLAMSDVEQNVWRLPTVEEAVRSMARHGRNCEGVWDGLAARATYRTTPDKESPLWDTRSPVIYWWTGTEVDDERAYMIVYDGRVWPREKRFAPRYFAFRGVRDVPAIR